MDSLVSHRAPKAPCIDCPWLVINHGRRHPSGWFTKANRDRLWARLRRGENMSCHRTDPNNPVTEKAQAAGYSPVPERARVRECAGAVILQQREVMWFQHVVDQADALVGTYRRLRPRGLTTEGLMAVASRVAFTWPGEIPMRRDHNLNASVSPGVPGLTWPPPPSPTTTKE